ITIPKQPVLGGAGGNPFIWVQFVNAAGTPTSDEIYLGRCVQGTRYGFNHAEITTGSAFAEFGISDCQNSPGPFISMDASLAYEGLGVQVIFRNNDNPVGGPHEATRSKTLSVIPPGLSFTFPKQPFLIALDALQVQLHAVGVRRDAGQHLPIERLTVVRLLAHQVAPLRPELLLRGPQLRVLIVGERQAITHDLMEPLLDLLPQL